MKIFNGVKPLHQIITQAQLAGVDVDNYNYRVKGADYIAFGIQGDERPDGTPLVHTTKERHVGGCVMFNTFNGSFFGFTDKGVEFNSSSTKHENEPWFQALLSFFYK